MNDKVMRVGGGFVVYMSDYEVQAAAEALADAVERQAKRVGTLKGGTNTRLDAAAKYRRAVSARDAVARAKAVLDAERADTLAAVKAGGR